jgi:hypothetical protein
VRALTVTQPWLGPIAASVKLIENRPTRPIGRAQFGERFALHAGREVDEMVYGRIRQIAPALFFGWSPDFEPSWPAWYRISRITSAVVATCRVVGCVVLQDNDVDARDLVTGELVDLGEQRRWFFGLYGYLLADVQILARPVPMRGWQGFWRINDEQKVREIERGMAA